MSHTETYVNGVWYPSVTTVLAYPPKPWLEKWREKWGALAERKTALANLVGTEFHRCIQSLIETGEYNPGCHRVARMMSTFERWSEHVDAKIGHTELKVLNRAHRYSGTLDAVGEMDGVPTVFDWKSSACIYPDMELQLTAYAAAYEEMYGIKIKKGVIVLVSKDKPHHGLTVKEYKLGKRPFKKFLSRLKQFNAAMEKAA